MIKVVREYRTTSSEKAWPAPPFVQRCIFAGELCATACGLALAADPSYTSPGTEPYSGVHLALVSCESVCSLVVRALRAGDGDLELVRWCAEICFKCAEAAAPDSMPCGQWERVVAACRRCADSCQAVVDLLSASARDAANDTSATDPQLLLEH